MAATPPQDVLQGTLDLLILRVVALEPMHGYRIAQRIQQISRDTFLVKQGSLYPALHRLESRGWLTAEWGPSEHGRDAKRYAITRAGRRQLQAQRESWLRTVAGMALVLDGGSRGEA